MKILLETIHFKEWLMQAIERNEKYHRDYPVADL